MTTSVVSTAQRAARGHGQTSRAHWLNHAPFYRAAGAVAAVLPRRARLAVASAIGGAMSHACRAEARVVRANLTRVVPGIEATARARQVRELFGHFAMCFADLLTTNRMASPAGLVGAGEGDEHVTTVLAGGGFIVLTAHVGNWELAGRMLVGRGGGRPLHIVMAPEADPGVERLLRVDGAPVRFVTLRTPADAVPLVAALRRGEIVGMQGDRALGHRGDVPVEFFGTPARFPIGPFLLARAAGVPILPAFCVLGADRRYAVDVQTPLRIGRGEEEAGLRRWVDGVASVIARHPTQWFNFFDPWSVAPAR